MNYQSGNMGRVIVARFEHGEDILAGLTDLVHRENIRAATFQLVGALSGGKFVVGPKEDTLPPEPEWRALEKAHETLGFGTIFWEEDTPKVHVHGIYSRGDSVKAGCLRELSEVFLVAEIVITELCGITACRTFDPNTGLVLLTL